MTAVGEPARWWHALPDAEPAGTVQCDLCPQRCRIRPGSHGICRYRVNRDGELRSTNYGRISSSGYDPIEKKPLYHFRPGSLILSLGTVGCNLGCGFCQNWRISQEEGPTRYLSPAAAAELAGPAQGAGRAKARGYPDDSPAASSIGIAYTYSEPLVWWEYVRATAELVHERGLANILVTNGFVESSPLEELLPYIDAMNVDLKAFTDDFYRQTCRGRLAPVLNTVEMAHARGVHVEVTTLLVPGLNDGPGEVRELASWLGRLDRGLPLHFSRYFPNYRMMEPGPTPAATLVSARDIAREYLDYVYIGNAFEVESADTICPDCGLAVIRRDGFRISPEGLSGNLCSRCGRTIVSGGLGPQMC